MAGCQSYQWAAQYPGMVKAILPFCASSKTSIHNHVFLEGVKPDKFDYHVTTQDAKNWAPKIIKEIK